jgi:bifunctional UDP-N-acetylglucosamine pyrophosphorylase/glucosamine-1-phosphate N-acetyltransferase
VIGFETDVENQYGRLILDHNDNLVKITEFKDANSQERNVRLCNSGVMAINLKYASSFLDKVDNNNNNKEYYLTDVVEIALKEGFEVGYLKVDYNEVQGVNNKQDLARANKYYYKILADKYMSQGLTLLDPDNTYLSADLEIGKDIIIEPNVTIKGKVKIADNVRINSYSYIEHAIINESAIIGPFARIRPKSTILSNAHIGNFVEIKNSVIGQASKVNHLSYIGDSDIAEKVNIGAGTITCNYDGYYKHKTVIKKDSFIGSNSCLIAPLTIGEGSVVAAGSVITDDIPDNCVTISRTKQKNLINGAKKYHAKKQNNQ